MWFPSSVNAVRLLLSLYSTLQFTTSELNSMFFFSCFWCIPSFTPHISNRLLKAKQHPVGFWTFRHTFTNILLLKSQAGFHLMLQLKGLCLLLCSLCFVHTLQTRTNTYEFIGYCFRRDFVQLIQLWIRVGSLCSCKDWSWFCPIFVPNVNVLV